MQAEKHKWMLRAPEVEFESARADRVLPIPIGLFESAAGVGSV